MDVPDPLVPERWQRALDRLALRVQDPLLGTDEYAYPQRSNQEVNGSPVSRS
jgi:hypothetical protein